MAKKIVKKSGSHNWLSILTAIIVCGCIVGGFLIATFWPRVTQAEDVVVYPTDCLPCTAMELPVNVNNISTDDSLPPELPPLNDARVDLEVLAPEPAKVVDIAQPCVINASGDFNWRTIAALKSAEFSGCTINVD